MKRLTSSARCGLAAVFAAFFLAAPAASALDAYQDRSGLTYGAGLVGGAVFSGEEQGGAFGLELKLGGGASRTLCLGLDVDLTYELIADHAHFIVTPGPEINVFLVDGLFLRGGVGMALVTTSWEDDRARDFNLGVEAGLGLGYELFMSANLAIGFALEGSWTGLAGDDLLGALFALELMHY